MLSREQHFRIAATHSGLMPVSQREIQYLDTAPRKIEVQISLQEYFERVKRYKADRFQIDLCARLQSAAENRHLERLWTIIHAEAQLGKTSVISQCFPAWLIGHDPLFRFALAMYNVTRSQAHSSVVIQIMQGNLHKDIFPEKDGFLYNDAQAGWMTNARRELNDGQLSFNPVGLQSGLTGSGFDWLSIDDPYKESKEAFSATVRENMANFWDYTVEPRNGEFSCVSGMFHRYAPEDFAGFLLDKGDFDYWRYATICDGDYVHEETGQVFPDPLDRKIGEYISPERRKPSYYEKSKKNNRVWLSMFQGKPSSDEGDFFNVGKIKIISKEQAEIAKQECVVVTRSYDHASTEEAGAYSVGVKGGMRPNGTLVIFDIWRERVDTAKRLQNQEANAKADGADVTVTVPIDPGSAGQDVVWFIQQKLENYTVVGRSTSGSKEDRALNLSTAVNAGEVAFVDDADIPEDKQWIKTARRELRDFPLSEFKDIVDAMSDNYNYNYEIVRKGLLVKNYKPQRNLAIMDKFIERFPNDENAFKLPPKWEIYAGVKLSLDASRPTCAVITARASANSGLKENIFVVGEYKAFDANFYRCFKWIEDTLAKIAYKSNITVWATPDSASALETVNQKLPFGVQVFDADEIAGITELNWYLLPTERANPFNAMESAAHLYFIINADQFDSPDKPELPERSFGFYHARQELKTWGYDDKGKPTKVGAILDCLRMITYKFRTFEEPLTIQEEFQELLGDDHLPKKNADGTVEMTMQKQMQMEYDKFRAKEILREKHGEDVFEQDEPEIDIYGEECALCENPFESGVGFVDDETYGLVHILCLQERKSFEQNNIKKEWWK